MNLITFVLAVVQPESDHCGVPQRGKRLRKALLLSIAVSALFLGGSMLVVWASRRRTELGS
jgi:hypothetical protein